MHTDVCDEKIIYKAKRILGKNNSDESVQKFRKLIDAHFLRDFKDIHVYLQRRL